QAGIGSRRVAEEMILAGRVAVNGSIARLGDRARIGDDLVEVDGEPGRPLPRDYHLHYLRAVGEPDRVHRHYLGREDEALREPPVVALRLAEPDPPGERALQLPGERGVAPDRRHVPLPQQQDDVAVYLQRPLQRELLQERQPAP
ncbi:MAG: hypothetical protein JRN29_03305, partial [Nitrososphaerota archaeon]|nr:hypothetical protein [Nitrososphaerota archaeon]